ncbi:transcription initiation protein spt4 [Coprinopsis marcescibilis]|uniref:Transcription elongation factor SPT4 n=1 Tax=Coprinopsis marcescibilis TaxID=230819 RepID=A0A5C3KXQ8_COPMA|nr:transcription initiation protein spt4 [Coprinopsis marcescibilis]
MAVIPPQPRSNKLRACLLCSIVQLPSDFKRNGCPNCDDILQLKGNVDRVNSCTTALFEGVIAVVDPDNSWVAKWQRTSQKVRGIYAVRVRGRVPEDVEAELQDRGLKYRPRDQTEQD